MSKPTDERLAELTDKLQAGIQELYSSGKYEQYLAAMSKFHHYSFGNIMLIFMQCPHASCVAGYNTWRKEFGRNVKRHEKGISILAPCPSRKYVWQEVKDPKTGKVQYNRDGTPKMETQVVTVTHYKIATVFDVSQTEGRELPTLGVDRLTGDVENYQHFYDTLLTISPVPVTTEVIRGQAKVLAYRVTEQFTVLPYDTSHLGVIQGKDLCTLVTCVPIGINSHRLLIRGERTAYTEANEETAEVQQNVEPAPSAWVEQYKLGILIGSWSAAAISLVALIWKQCKRLRYNTKSKASKKGGHYLRKGKHTPLLRSLQQYYFYPGQWL